jgi:hypothetical protein
MAGAAVYLSTFEVQRALAERAGQVRHGVAAGGHHSEGPVFLARTRIETW